MIRSRRYTKEMLQFIADTYKKVGIADVAAAFNEKYNSNKTPRQIKATISNHKITSGRTGHFEKGQESWNSGKKGWTAGGRSAETRFKKGRESGDIKPLGATRICSKDGYVIIKVAMPNRWRAKHLVEWEKVNGKIPVWHRVWFIDNDRTNNSVDNLMLITRAQGAVINKLGMGNVPAEYKEAALLLADITMKRTKLTKAGE